MKLVAATIVLAAIAFGVFKHEHKGTANHVADISSLVHADSCAVSGYYIENRLDGSKEQLYDCVVAGEPRCFTYSGGIARDETETAKLLFADTYQQGELPTCAEGAV